MSLVRKVEKSLMEGLPILLHFPRFSLNEWITCEGLLHSKEGNILKQSQAFLSIRWLSASSCSDSGSLTMETAIFVKSHLKKWLLSLPRDAKNSVNPVNLNTRFTELTEWVGRRAARGIPAHILRWDWGVLKMAPMANGGHVSFKWNLSLRKLEHWRPGRGSSAFQCTTY